MAIRHDMACARVLLLLLLVCCYFSAVRCCFSAVLCCYFGTTRMPWNVLLVNVSPATLNTQAPE